MITQFFAQKSLLLSPNHSYKEALEWSKSHYLHYTPILDGNSLAGYLDLKALQSQDIPLDTPISELLPYYAPPISVSADEHIYDALLKLQYQDVLVILNSQNEYEGIISIHQIPDILKHLQLQNFIGGTLVLTIGHKNYSLSEIARIAESCDAKIISLFLSQHPEQNLWYLNLKFNTEDLSRIVAAYERFGYEIAYVNQKQLALSDTSTNYESLMKFLEI
ncbi:MAG: hypothetical protein KatS3mg035_0774 [Bacteroidia bacterium]|nr:MAG: hypothetical protein KatS3mg035_0774 [Bacteroidia bacterium]